ncbi:membrane protein [Herbaspirillum rubrisubalbicans]|uniref:Membrane protein n=1 Tax=Herbaspirillum rubrisubalbicans TaxID=80842 RepID=A0ABX9BZ03_9BURK|nr:urate hydroxylase PuuD [Herbaspirillum rubrisubalbicans]RAM63174.1 membrane protein [Herbaspirillum rubrisubalbicans]RAN44292.1 membrane protein [Herbaspirillum rubrisubalbicans]
MEALLVAYGLEWANLLVRWLHLITGIAWIGASFYFVWLDNSIRPPKPGSDLEKKGVAGELWAVHGGGFYHPQKYLVAPAELPAELHWFKWEAYATWMSGIAMLLIVYYFNASAMMVDKSVADLSGLQAVGVGIATLVLGWIVYDLLCRSPLGKREGLLGLVMFVFIVAVAYLLTHLLSGRAAYIHVGAMIGTIMVGNVLMVIIPGQRKLVAAMQAGRAPDPIHGQRGKQRSVHNNYFTLPILFIMISNHYAMTYTHAYSWLVLAAIMAAGVLIRHFFNLRHKGRIAVAYPLAGVALLVVVAVAIAPRPVAPTDPVAQGAGGAASVASVPAAAPDFARVQSIITQRCATCHSDKPTQPGFATAPAGMMLHTPELIHQHAAKIFQRAVQTRDMPLANLTRMTDEERAELAAWFQAGAK